MSTHNICFTEALVMSTHNMFSSRKKENIYLIIWILFLARAMKKKKRKVQGVPQSQTAALPRSQEEEETNKSKQAQTEQTYEKHKD